MQTAPRNPGLRPWVVPLVLAGLVLPSWLGAIGASGSALGWEEGNAGHGTAALTTSLAWRGAPQGRLSPDYSVSATRMDRERGTSIQSAIVSVGLKTVATSGNDAPSVGGADEVAGSIEALLGQLNTRYESTLREALSGMRDADEARLSRRDPDARRRVTWWADEFSTRLAAAAIPAGTRERLTAKLASWQHGTDASIDVSRDGPHGTANASVSVVSVSENADAALLARRDQDTHPFKTPWWITWLLLGIPVAVGVLLASSAGIRSQRPRNVSVRAPKASASQLRGFGRPIF